MDTHNEVYDLHTKNMLRVLGVREDATPLQLRKAYLEKSKYAHPDKHPPSMKDQKTKEFLQLQDAYNWLNARHQCRVNMKEEFHRGGVRATNANVSNCNTPTTSVDDKKSKMLSSQINLVAFGLVVGPRRKS